MTVKFKKLTPDLMVPDVAKTVRFYTEKLGFKLNMLVPEKEQTMETDFAEGKKYLCAMVSRDEVFVMFIQKDMHANDIPILQGVPISASAIFYCDVDNVGELYGSFKKNEVEILKNLSTTWYGMKEFYIRDCNGYILGFAERAQQPATIGK